MNNSEEARMLSSLYCKPICWSLFLQKHYRVYSLAKHGPQVAHCIYSPHTKIHNFVRRFVKMVGLKEQFFLMLKKFDYTFF